IFVGTMRSSGIHSITASYGGSAPYLSSVSDALALIVGNSGTSVSISAAPAPSVFGQAVALSAHVTPATSGSAVPTGTVSFVDGSNLIGTANMTTTGNASLTTTALVAGLHSLTSRYSGDGGFAPSTSTALPHQVNKANT